jgi:hypothetical protein
VKDNSRRMSEASIRYNLAWLTKETDKAKEKGGEPPPEVLHAIGHLQGLLNKINPAPPPPDTAASVVAEFMAKTLDRLRWELWRHHKAAEAAQLDYLAERLSFACGLILRLREDVERWREVSPHIGWRCRVIYKAVTRTVEDDTQAHGMPQDDDDEVMRAYRIAIRDLRGAMRSDKAQSCVDAVGIVTIVADDIRLNKISGLSGCRDAAMAYINYSLQGVI